MLRRQKPNAHKQPSTANKTSTNLQFHRRGEGALGAVDAHDALAETRILPAVHGFLDARVVAEVGVGEWRRLLAGIGDDGHAADAVAGCVRFVPRVVALSNAKPAQRSAQQTMFEKA